MTIYGLPGFTGESLPLAPGSLFGFRAFDITADTGDLKGVTFPEVWKDGENTASCPRKRMAHSMEKCSHGYWSYFGVTNAYFDVERAKAIIEGYGEVVVGEDGFRSQKARLKAVVLPNLDEIEKRGKSLHFLADELKRIRRAVIARTTSILFSLIVLFSVVDLSIKYISDTDPSSTAFLFPVIMLVLTTGFGLSILNNMLKVKEELNNKRNLRKSKSPVNASSVTLTQEKLTSLVQERYPSIKIYDDLGDMISDYQDKIILHGSLLGADETITDTANNHSKGEK